MSAEHVELQAKRNRGWPWPEDSWGLTPMYSDEGWCRSCGMPQRPQSGSLVLQAKGLRGCTGAWVPNWQFDAICVERSLGNVLADRFDLDLRPVEWHKTAPCEALQIIVPSVGLRWFAEDELAARATARHGTAGNLCADCEVWRWMPLPLDALPALEIDLGDITIAASPEWFGDGCNSFRQILVRRDVAEVITEASPRDFVIREVA